jgi:flagellar hook-associated protein 3 FlgL
MSATSVSTNYLATSLLPSISKLQSQITDVGVEVSTGQYADLGLQLGGQSGYELSLKNQYELLQTQTSDNNVVTTNLTTAQDALNSILSGAQSAVSSLTEWSSTSSTAGATLQTIGSSALQTLTSMANSTSGDVYVFGGVNTSEAPMADYFSSTTSAAKSAIDSAFESEFGCSPTDSAASSISASDMQSFLDGPYADLFSGANWTTNWSSASSTNVTSQIAPGETIETSTNANQTGFQQLAEGYAMLAAFGNTSLSTAAQKAVVSTATSLITQGENSITAAATQVGAAQTQVTDANNAMSSQMTILQTQIGKLDDVDSTTASTELTSLQTQLEAAYEMTDRLEKLNLAQYLPAS